MEQDSSRGMVRQGDVLLVPVKGRPLEALDEAKDARGVVLAEGETSGHFHAVTGGEAHLFRFRDGRANSLLEVGTGGATVRVIGGGAGGMDRHTPIAVEKGLYEVRLQKRWDSAAMSAFQVHD